MQPRNYGPFKYSPIVGRPVLKWPHGARVAVWIIPNVEFFPLDELMRTEAAITPNVMPWSRRDYGNRIGVFRLMEALGKRNIRATVALNSFICHHHPQIIKSAMELEWELMGHCQTNARPLHKLPPEQERGAIADVVSTIEAACGRRPRGWLGSGGNETWNSLDYLSAEGIRYVGDWTNDDQPYVMDIGDPLMVSIPYAAEINDTVMVNRKNHSSEEFADMIQRQFDVLYDEGAKTGKVMAIALHPWISGVPHRIRSLGRALDYMAAHDDVWFATGSEIVEAYLAQNP